VYMYKYTSGATSSTPHSALQLHWLRSGPQHPNRVFGDCTLYPCCIREPVEDE